MRLSPEPTPAEEGNDYLDTVPKQEPNPIGMPAPAEAVWSSTERLTLDLGELWEHRELLPFFVWRDLKVRYAQTVLGVAWTVVQPLLAMVVFSVFLGRLAGVPSDGVPYPVFSLAGLVPWTFFAAGVGRAAGSLVSNQGLLTKVYFPRMALPIAAVLAGLLDLAIAVAVLLGMLLVFGMVPPAKAFYIVPLAGLALVAALGTGLWLAALNVKYRDVQQMLPFLLQLWLFATPVVYPSSLLAESWRPFYALNPMVGVVEGFRWALLDTQSAPVTMVTVSTAVAVTVLVAGAYFFRRTEHSFADIV